MHAFIHATLWHVLWTSIFASGVWLVTRLWRNPYVAHTLWLLVLVKLVLPPVWSLSIPLPHYPDPLPQPPSQPPARIEIPAHLLAPSNADTDLARAATFDLATVAQATEPNAPTAKEPPALPRDVHRSKQWLPTWTTFLGTV